MFGRPVHTRVRNISYGHQTDKSEGTKLVGHIVSAISKHQFCNLIYFSPNTQKKRKGVKN